MVKLSFAASGAVIAQVAHAQDVSTTTFLTLLLLFAFYVVQTVLPAAVRITSSATHVSLDHIYRILRCALLVIESVLPVTEQPLLAEPVRQAKFTAMEGVLLALVTVSLVLMQIHASLAFKGSLTLMVLVEAAFHLALTAALLILPNALLVHLAFP
jgi:hypothetical protein